MVSEAPSGSGTSISTLKRRIEEKRKDDRSVSY
jgi:hypothetical protein